MPAAAPTALPRRPSEVVTIHQLRNYEIFEDTKDAFHARFRDHATRIMRRYGFHIVAMWEAKMDSEPSSSTSSNGQMRGRRRTHGRLLWTIASGRGSNALHRAKAALVGEIEDRRLVGYSPPLRPTATTVSIR